MKTIFEQVIRRGNYDLAGVLTNIDRYHIEGKLSDDERAELYSLARQDAEPQYNVADEINRLWAAVRELRDTVAQLAAGAGQDDNPGESGEEPEAADEYPEYVQPTGAHDAYNTGDKVLHNGKRYVCQMAGCVWAPDVYPAAWLLVEEGGE